MTKCPANTDPNSQWPGFCPNIGAAYLFAILFGLVTCAHVAQAIIHRKGYAWVISMAAAWQTLSYVFRILSINNVTNETWYIIWFLLILLAPLLINAFVYMVLGRMVYNFTVKAKILGIKAWRFTLLFVLLDIVAFITQAAGASMASGTNLTHAQIFRGLHIYMGGIGLQWLFIFCFTFLAIRFQKEMTREASPAEKPKALRLLYVLYAVLILISIRIIFRLIEYSQGYSSGIPVHEAYQYVFDSTMMLVALVLFNIFHPGRIMPGKESDFPSRKERKALGKNNVMGRAAGGALPLYEVSPDAGVSDTAVSAEQNPTYPKLDQSNVSYGYVREFDH